MEPQTYTTKLQPPPSSAIIKPFAPSEAETPSPATTQESRLPTIQLKPSTTVITQPISITPPEPTTIKEEQPTTKTQPQPTSIQKSAASSTTKFTQAPSLSQWPPPVANWSPEAEGTVFADPGTGTKFKHSCYEQYPGYDIENREKESMAACIAWGAEADECVAANWYNAGPQGTGLNSCWLKSDHGRARKTKDAQNVVRID
ncbi:hypothetical protein DL771_007748 [Monosporascus sp. 5C6A]|nr:hypothetical protein DL771_007748 [Monosporascus sp. 5C6A]